MKIYNKKGATNYVEKRLINLISEAINLKREINPDYANDLQTAENIEELRALHSKYVLSEEVPVIKNESTPATEEKTKITTQQDMEVPAEPNKKTKMPTKKQRANEEITNTGSEDIVNNDAASSEPPPVVKKEGFTIAELEANIDNATLNYSKGNKTEENTGGSQANTEDPDYIPEHITNPMDEEVIQNESEANMAGKKASAKSGGGENQPPKEFAEPVINGVASPSDGENIKPPPAPPKKPLNPQFDSMSPTDRRKQVEMFADAILANYAQIMPLIPKWIAKYDVDKLEMLDDKGIIRLSMVIERDEYGVETTIQQYVNGFNEKVDETFVVTDDMKKELREPLIAVLMEKGIAPTPIVTLALLVFQQVLTFVFMALGIRKDANKHMSKFERFRKDELDKEKEEHKGNQFNQSENQSPPSTDKTETAEKQPIKTTTKKGKEGNNGSEIVKMEDIIEEKTSIMVKSGGNSDIDMTGITIEEVIEE